MKRRLLATLRALLHANLASLGVFALLFGLLWLAGLGVPLSLVLSKGLRPADRVIDGCGLIPPKGGHHHGPRSRAG